MLFAGGGQEGQRRTANKEIDVVDVYDAAQGTMSTVTLFRAREIAKPAVIPGKVLFVGGQLGCNGCPYGAIGVIADIYAPGT